jgi:hypothetical protein
MWKYIDRRGSVWIDMVELDIKSSVFLIYAYVNRKISVCLVPYGTYGWFYGYGGTTRTPRTGGTGVTFWQPFWR